MRCAVAIAVAASIALGQEAGHAVISGTVVEASTGEPVRKAIVTLTLQGDPKRWATARSDSSGQFAFSRLPPGKYDLRAAREGLGTAIYGATGPAEIGELISLDEGETRGALKLLFIHSGSITGHVFEPDGDPAANISVTLQSASRNFNKRVLVNLRDTAADYRGAYRFTGLSPGDYYLFANPLIGPMGESPPNANGLLTAQYYGGSREWKDSTVLHIRSGESLAGVDFHLSADSPRTIRGHVTGVPDLGPSPDPSPSGPSVPTRYVGIHLAPAEEGGSRWRRDAVAAAPDFSFDFPDLPGGAYRIEARFEVRADFFDKVWEASQVLDTLSTGDEVVLALAPAVDIKGQLRIEGEQARSVVRVRLTREGSINGSISERPAADGSFMLKQVPAGEWRLDEDALPSGSFLKSVQFGDKNVRFTPITIRPGAAGPFSIVISMRPGKLTGEIETAGGDSKRAGIVLAPTGQLRNQARLYYTAVSDDSGKFQFPHVMPGKYKIFALERLLPQQFRNPESADQLGDLGTEIELTEGAVLTVHPKLIPTERAREALTSEVGQ